MSTKLIDSALRELDVTETGQPGIVVIFKFKHSKIPNGFDYVDVVIPAECDGKLLAAKFKKLASTLEANYE